MKFESKFETAPDSFYGKEPGFIELTESNELIFYKKSKFIRAAFGLIGSALDSGKEVLRFNLAAVESYEEPLSAKNGNERVIRLKDGRYARFTISGSNKAELDSRMQPYHIITPNVTEKKADPVVEQKPFVCKKCGESFTGWYSTCPNCKTQNSMERRK